MRLTTCIRLTNNSFPKLSLKHSPLLKRRDSRSAGYTGGPVNIPAVSFPWGYRGEYFPSSTCGKAEKVFYSECRIRAYDPMKPWYVDEDIC